jgi:hypothetical protein
MDNVITEKRGLVIILIIATVLIFVGLVWAIATYLPLKLLGIPNPSFTATVLVGGKNCTYPVDYWKSHPERYPAQLVIGGQVYKAKEIGRIFLDVTADTSTQLQAQLTGAYLNFLSGADQRYIETTIFEAYGWLVQHPAGSALTDNERQAGTRLFTILETYNQGLTEVAPCEPGLAQTITETINTTGTPNLLLTITPSQTVTPTSSETATPTNTPILPVFTLREPTLTPIPTTSVPEQPSTTPSQTLSPSATNTPINTTEAPPPTRTATIAPTLPPTETPSPTFPPP